MKANEPIAFFITLFTCDIAFSEVCTSTPWSQPFAVMTFPRLTSKNVTPQTYLNWIPLAILRPTCPVDWDPAAILDNTFTPSITTYFSVICKLIDHPLCIFIQILIKLMNQNGSNTDPWSLRHTNSNRYLIQKTTFHHHYLFPTMKQIMDFFLYG